MVRDYDRDWDRDRTPSEDEIDPSEEVQKVLDAAAHVDPRERAKYFRTDLPGAHPRPGENLFPPEGTFYTSLEWFREEATMLQDI